MRPRVRRDQQGHADQQHAGHGRRAHPADHTLARVSIGVAITVGAVAGLALGIVVSLTTDVPLAPELGLALGALVGWLARRDGG